MKSLRRKIQEFQKKNKNFRSLLIEELLKNLIKGPEIVTWSQERIKKID